MFTRRVVTFLAAFVITLSALAIWSAQGDVRDGDTDSNVVASSGAETGARDSTAKKKGGGFFGKILKAPFKAVGSLFGRGDQKLSRMSERDAERFESAAVLRVEDSTTDKKKPADDGDDSAQACLARGREYLQEGMLNEAIAELSRAASLDPKLSQAHSLLAVAYDQKGLHDRANDSYKKAVDVNERDPEALNNLGYSLYLNGNYRAAVDKLRRAAKYAPNDARILNNLALAQCRLGRYDDAYRNFARAGGEYSGHANVAALLIRMGRDDKAVGHLEAARRLQPNSPNVLRQLAELYERTGDKAKADDARQALSAADAKQAVASTEER